MSQAGVFPASPPGLELPEMRRPAPHRSKHASTGLLGDPGKIWHPPFSAGHSQQMRAGQVSGVGHVTGGGHAVLPRVFFLRAGAPDGPKPLTRPPAARTPRARTVP